MVVSLMCEDDGGSYAIKGFLYQFDKTIIEILNNPNKSIYFEHIQDIDYEDYVIQVKNRSTSTFTNSKIKKPVIQLLGLYKNNTDKKFCLYCYFCDKSPCKYKLTSVEELNKVINYRKQEENVKLSHLFDDNVRRGFIKNFTIIFSDDYETQFDTVIQKIKTDFNLPSEEDALLYHSIIRSKLLSLATNDNKEERSITKTELENYIDYTQNNIFYSGYRHYLGRSKYIKYVKNRFFTFRRVNINPYERLFVIDCSDSDNYTIIRSIIENIKNRYFKLKKSPAPYICFRGISETHINEIKMSLIDDGIVFSDGTCFNGDKFRIDKLIQKVDKNNVIEVKFINKDKISELMSSIPIKECYHLFKDNPIKFNSKYREIEVQIEKTEEVLEMII